jgi:predicted  nucleic acid-binding Zn-ribbon protein
VRIVEQVEALGEVRYRDRTAEDVTDQVTDVEARVATQRASIARLRVLLDDAADLRDVVTLEGELARREADLDSLLRRQAAPAPPG